MKTIKCISLLLIVGIIMIGACGCVGKEDVNYLDEAYNFAKEYLQKKYDMEFEIENLERKDSGVFRTKEYIGIAYPIDSNDDKFTVWVNPKEKTVVDSFECIKINEIANSWALEKATHIWPGAEIKLLTLLVSKPSEELSFYNNDNIEKYFLKEFSNNEIVVFVPNYSKDELEIKNIFNFLQEVKSVTNGLLHLNYADMEQKELVVSLAADKEAIEKEIMNWRKQNG